MNITSPEFQDSKQLPARYSRRGGDISPALNFSDVPPQAASLALDCFDIDATGGWTHWLVWNIAPTTQGFKEGELPEDVIMGRTDWNENKWGGPMPPSGTHRYVFTLYALSDHINLPQSASRHEVLEAMDGKIITKASITGLFSSH